MKRNTQHLENQLIELLADGSFHSGQELADRLGVSRSAIHKRIAALEALELDVFRVHGRGYRLSQPIELLNEQRLQQSLSGGPTVYLKRITSSTHDDLKRLLAEQQSLGVGTQAGTAVIAEMQTAGRGRRGKTWLSPFGANLYLSLYWPLLQGLNGAVGMSIAIGIAVARLLQQNGIEDISVKWPNDVYIQGAKVSGILIELEGQPTGEGHALIGIGLNLDMPKSNAERIDQAFTDVRSHLSKPLSRHQWAAQLIHECRRILLEYDSEGLQPLIAEWRKLDHFYMKPVRLLLGQHEQQGIAEGIDEHGALLVRQQGQLKRYFGGEISLRAKL